MSNELLYNNNCATLHIFGLLNRNHRPVKSLILKLYGYYMIINYNLSSPEDILCIADPAVCKPWLFCALCLAGDTLFHCYHNWSGRVGSTKKDWKVKESDH